VERKLTSSLSQSYGDEMVEKVRHWWKGVRKGITVSRESQRMTDLLHVVRRETVLVEEDGEMERTSCSDQTRVAL